MDQDLYDVETKLTAIPGYVTEFKNVFESKPNKDEIANALAAFQRTMVTSPSPFDLLLAGDKDAVSARLN